jgi:hypothetical protein
MEMKSPRFFDDPFRPLFLIGYTLGILGLGVWLPALFDREWPYPGRGHALLTMQGFLCAFSFGILLTDIPARLGLKAIPRIPLAMLAFLLSGMGVCALNYWFIQGEWLFLAACLLVCGYLAQSLFLAKKSPGPDFLFLASAPIMAAAGAALRIVSGMGMIADSRWDRLGALAVYQGFFLLFALGALPQQARVRGKVKFDNPGLRWNLNIALAVLLAVALVLEAFAPGFGKPSLAIRAAYLIKVALLGWLLFMRTGPKPLPPTGAAHPRGVILGLIITLFGMGLPALFPRYAIGLSHFAYVGGFAWLVLDQAARVLEGRFSLSTPMKGWGNIALFGSLLFLGALMRVVAEFAAPARSMLLFLAVLFVLAPFLAWTWRNLPYLGGRPDPRSRKRAGMRGAH